MIRNYWKATKSKRKLHQHGWKGKREGPERMRMRGIQKGREGRVTGVKAGKMYFWTMIKNVSFPTDLTQGESPDSLAVWNLSPTKKVEEEHTRNQWLAEGEKHDVNAPTRSPCRPRHTFLKRPLRAQRAETYRKKNNSIKSWEDEKNGSERSTENSVENLSALHLNFGVSLFCILLINHWQMKLF